MQKCHLTKRQMKFEASRVSCWCSSCSYRSSEFWFSGWAFVRVRLPTITFPQLVWLPTMLCVLGVPVFTFWKWLPLMFCNVFLPCGFFLFFLIRHPSNFCYEVFSNAFIISGTKLHYQTKVDQTLLSNPFKPSEEFLSRSEGPAPAIRAGLRWDTLRGFETGVWLLWLGFVCVPPSVCGWWF